MKTALFLIILFASIALLVDGLYEAQTWKMIAAPIVFIGALIFWFLSNVFERPKPMNWDEEPPTR